MKNKLILIILIFLALHTQTFAECTVNKNDYNKISSSEFYKINNISKILIQKYKNIENIKNILVKLKNNTDSIKNTQLFSLILKNIECSQFYSIEGFDSDSLFPSIHQSGLLKYVGLKKGAVKQFDYIIKNSKGNLYAKGIIKENITLYQRTGAAWRDSKTCSKETDWNYVKVYIPAGTSTFKILSVTGGKIKNEVNLGGTNSNFRLYYKFEEDNNKYSTFDRVSKSLKGGMNKNSFYQAVTNVGGMYFNFDNSFKGKWLYIMIIGDENIRESSYNDSKGHAYSLSISYKINDIESYNNWKNNVKLKANGDPIEKTKLRLDFRDCDNGDIYINTYINSEKSKEITFRGNGYHAAGYDRNGNSALGFDINHMQSVKLKDNCYKLTSRYIHGRSSCIPTSIGSSCLADIFKARYNVPSCSTIIHNQDGSIVNCEKTTQHPNAEISPITSNCCLNGIKEGSVLGTCK